jgi:hypothetical protein
MATATTTSGTRVQTWLSRELAIDLKRRADLERRSVSALVRHAIEDRLRQDGEAGRRES